MSAKSLRFGLRQLFAAITLTAIILGVCIYVVKRYREEQIRIFQEAYLEGRVSESTAREYVGDDIVDSWPEPEHPSVEADDLKTARREQLIDRANVGKKKPDHQNCAAESHSGMSIGCDLRRVMSQRQTIGI
jgi:hypothetical protein